MVMPEMNGKELAAKLLSFVPHLKTLFMSGYTMDLTELDSSAEHEMNFIRKPFKINDLTSTVRTMLT